MIKVKGENKLTVTVKILLWEFNIYWKFMCTDKNNKKKTNLPPLPFHSSYSFLNCWKTTKPMTLKFLDFQFVFIKCFVSVIAWVDYFVLQICWRRVEKNFFFNFWVLTHAKPKLSKYFRNNVKTKVFL